MHINAHTSKYRNMNPTQVYWNALGSTERVREGAVCCAVERCLSSPGRPGCWRENQTCTSWQAERELCADWTETWSPCFGRNAPLHRRKILFLKKRELPTTDLSLCLSLKTGRIHRNRRGTPPRCSSSFQVPTTALPPLFLVSSFLSPSASSAPSPGNVLTVSSCFLVSASSGGVSQLLSCCATAAERFPFLLLRLKGAVATKKKWGRAAARSFCCCSNLITGGGPTVLLL